MYLKLLPNDSVSNGLLCSEVDTTNCNCDSDVPHSSTKKENYVILNIKPKHMYILIISNFKF